MTILQGGDGSARGGHGIGMRRVANTRAILAAFLTSTSLGFLSLAMPAEAQVRTESVSFDIPSQPVNEALLAFARQAGVRVVMPDAQFGNVRSNAVQGAYDRESALAELLRGTGVAARLENGAIVLQRSADTSRATQRAAPDASQAPFQLAQATPPRTSTTDAAAAFRLASDETDEEADKVVIIGTNIRGVYPGSSPVDIYTAEDIARTGATTTEQFIGKLTQNTGTIAPFGGVGDARESASGVDLRGLGVGTTLVLINGRRMSLASRGRSADISMIPASAIDRVEVLTDGASAIYGSDAIGGVVNFVLRKDFDGAETRMSYGGVTSGGLRQGNLTQTFGRRWGSGHGLVSYDYFNASALDRTDREYSRATAPGTLTPHDRRNSLLATFAQDFTDRLTLSGDVLWGRRDIKNSWSVTAANPLDSQLRTDSTDETQTQVNLGLDYEFSDSLAASLTASYSENETDRRSITTFFNDPSRPPANDRVANNHTGLDITAMLDGVLFALPGGDVRFSVGAGILDEEYTGENDNRVVTGSEIGRESTYAFAEIFAPLIGPEQGIPFVHRLELSLAGRYTGTEDTTNPSSIDRNFGDSTDPKIGLLWAPVSDLDLRATYGTSFRAPSLPQLDPVGASGGVIFANAPIPFPGGPLSSVFQLFGVSPDIDSESAETYTVGFDFRPESHPGFELSATYYSIDYTDRIQVPEFGALPLTNPADFPELMMQQPPVAVIVDLLTRNPVVFNQTSVNVSDIPAAAAIFAADPNFWVLDLRFRNLAVSKQDGLDLNVSNRFEVPWGEARVGANITNIFDYKQAALPNKPTVTVVDQANLPVDLRARIYGGLTHNGFNGTLSVNYIDDYINPGDPGGPRAVGSWTTADLHFSYDFGAKSPNSLLNGVRATLSVQNVLDRHPPYMASAGLDSRIGFDPQNANPYGRLVTVGLAKAW